MNINFFSYLPFLAVALPSISALLVYIMGDRNEKLRNSLVIIIAFCAFILVLLMYPQVIIKGQPIKVILPIVVRLKFFVDPLGLLFAVITSFVWLMAAIYSVGYMEHEHKRPRYYAFLLVLLGANLGTVLSGDLLSLFIFFEGLGILGYFLVIHSGTDEALRAGAKFIWMTVLGGLFLLSGIFLFNAYSGTFNLEPTLSFLKTPLNIKFIIAGLMIIGFGVKAGMIPLHVWLPEAHPVAPSPASALLSGVMIKAGAYGIIRIISNLFRPPFAGEASHAAEALWKTTSSLGYTIIWLGVITMFLGVCMALLQENSKRMLAYHSVSQMGYILMGIGAAGYLGEEGAFGFAGGIYHIINHALFKAALFLGVGAVYFRTGELNMYKLGGLRKKMPFTFIFTLIAALGISGIPLFNGFASKTLLHDAIIESYKHHHLISLKWAEIIFIITGGGTLCSFIKLIKFTFIDKPKDPKNYENIKDVPLPMKLGMGILAFFIVLLGFFPTLLTKTFINPSIKYWQLPTGHLEKFSFFSLQSFGGLLPSILIGISIFVIGMRYHLFHLHFPEWFGVDYWYERFAFGLFDVLREMTHAVRRMLRHWKIVSLIGRHKKRELEILSRLRDELEDERLRMVRETIEKLDIELRKKGISYQQRRKQIEKIREDINQVTEVLISERINVLKDLFHQPSLRAGSAKENLDAIIVAKAISRIPTEKIIEIIQPSEEGMENIKRKIMETVKILEREKGKQTETLGEMSGRIRHFLAEEKFDLALQRAAGEYKTVMQKYREAQRFVIKKTVEWSKSMARFLVEVLTEERVPWVIEKYISHEDVISVQKDIRKYTRDMSFNILVIMIIMVLLVGLLKVSNPI